MADPALPSGQVAARPDLRALLTRRHLPALDGLRALAVGTVILLHFDQLSGRSEIPGDLGVTAFFVLSGFLITWLLLTEVETTGRVSLSRFFLRRVFRILPAYYVFLAVAVSGFPTLGGQWTPPAIIASLFFVMNYFSIAAGWYHFPGIPQSHTWSLAIEEQFYLLWAPLAAWLLTRSLGLTARVLLVTILCAALWRTYSYQHWHYWPYTYKAFETRTGSLAIGCLIAVWARRDWFNRLSSRLAGSPWYPVATLALLWMLHSWTSESFQLGPGITLDSTLLGIFMVQVVLLSGHLGWRWLDHPVMRYLGSISYPLYLYHRLMIGLVRRTELSQSSKLAFVLCGSLAVASLSYYLIERPFLRLKRRFEVRPARGTAFGAWRAAASPTQQ